VKNRAYRSKAVGEPPLIARYLCLVLLLERRVVRLCVMYQVSHTFADALQRQKQCFNGIASAEAFS